jgi:hypothetical protein
METSPHGIIASTDESVVVKSNSPPGERRGSLNTHQPQVGDKGTQSKIQEPSKVKSTRRGSTAASFLPSSLVPVSPKHVTTEEYANHTPFLNSPRAENISLAQLSPSSSAESKPMIKEPANGEKTRRRGSLVPNQSHAPAPQAAAAKSQQRRRGSTAQITLLSSQMIAQGEGKEEIDEMVSSLKPFSTA